ANPRAAVPRHSGVAGPTPAFPDWQSLGWGSDPRRARRNARDPVLRRGGGRGAGRVVCAPERRACCVPCLPEALPIAPVHLTRIGPCSLAEKNWPKRIG